MQKIISIGDKVELKKIHITRKNDDEKIPVYPSRILDVKDNNVLQLAMPFYDGRVIPLAVHDKYELVIYAKNGLYTCDIIILERFKTGNMFYMDVAVYSDLHKIQRREFYRFAYRTNVEFRPVTETLALGEESVEKEPQSQTDWKSAVMLDLSGGGTRIVSAYELEKGSYIQLRFQIRSDAGTELLVLYGNIVRRLTMENNPQLKDYRIEFKSIDTHMQEKIIHFIFEEERRYISKK